MAKKMQTRRHEECSARLSAATKKIHHGDAEGTEKKRPSILSSPSYLRALRASVMNFLFRTTKFRDILEDKRDGIQRHYHTNLLRVFLRGLAFVWILILG
jgi:hypothetical protein